VLTRLRSAIERRLGGAWISQLPLSPNAITMLALALSSIVPLLACLGGPPPIVAIALLLSSALDALDGYVARKKGLRTPFGAFLDSTTDRISDALHTYALLIVGIMDYPHAFAQLVAEYMVSYTRARAESLGVSMEGIGLMERGERVLLKAAALLLYPFNVLASRAMGVLLTALTIVTVGHRIITAKKLLT